MRTINNNVIPFFRRIRKQLADENKPLQYSRYAIGEIVLVVVGILIALSINNWNEDRKTRGVTNEYLTNIKDDIVADTLNIKQMYAYGVRWEYKIGNYFEYFSEGEWTIQQIVDSCKNTGFSFTSYFPINNTYSDMLSSGHSSLLDDGIRIKLSELKKKQEELVLIINNMNSHIIDNVHELEGYWDLEDTWFFKSMSPESRKVIPFSNAIDLPNNDENLLLGLRYHHNIFNWMYKAIDLRIDRGDKIMLLSNEILELIEDELKD